MAIKDDHTITRVSRKKWREYIKRCHITNIYQDPRWLELIETVYPGLPVYRLCCMDDAQRLKYLLPVAEIKPLGKFRPMMISLPFANYGGYIFPENSAYGFSEKNADVSQACRDALESFFKSCRADVMEIRETQLNLKGNYVYNGYQQFEIDLPKNAETLWKNIISGNARTAVRKAERENIEVVVLPHAAQKIFTTFNEKNATFHGTPIHSAKWFSVMLQLFEKESCIVAAKYKNRFVGAAFVLNDGKRAILHALAADPVYRHLCISDKLVWESIRHVIENTTAVVFDFGRTRPDQGQLFFKKKWGGTAKPINYTYFTKPGAKIPQFNPDSKLFSMGSKIWRHMPLSFIRIIGPFLRKRISS